MAQPLNKEQNYKPGSFFTIVKDFLLSEGEIEGDAISPLAPWRTPLLTIDLSLLNVINKSQNNIIIKQNALYNLQNYEGCLQIYTDGSKTGDQSVGAAFVVPELDFTHAIRLPSFVTVYVSELVAIKFALEWILASLSNINKPVVILSDSVSALQSINNGNCKSRPTLLHSILVLLDTLFRLGKVTVTLAWVPAHVGIPGNERADLVAKRASITDTVNTSVLVGHANVNNRDDGVDPNVSLCVNITQFTNCNMSKCLQDVNRDIEEHVLSKWQARYSGATAGAFYKKLVPKVNKTIKFTSKTRRKDVTITRLRLGRPFLNYYLHKIGARDSPLCEQCKVDETVEHFIMHCTRYNILQHIHSSTHNTTCTLIDILTQHTLIDCLFDKIKTINRKI